MEELRVLEERLQHELSMIVPLDQTSMEQCQWNWDHIAKPLHSLGKLENGLKQIAGIQRTARPKISKKALVIMCADNGVVEEGVTQTGQDVTAIVAQNFLTGKTSAKLMAEHTGTKLYPIDIGMITDTSIINRKIAYGTKNFTKGPAMSREEALQAIFVGIDFVADLASQKVNIICTGEMGIGNTTTSSAIASLLLHVPVEMVTGRGAGLSSEGVKRKIDAIHRGIDCNQPKAHDPIDILSKVGGFDIAGLVGVFIGGAIYQIPVVMDGFISSVAALLAAKLNDKVIPYILASHQSKEPAGQMVLKAMDKEAYLNCDMCLGEGTGALALMPILDLAFCIYDQMSTFEEIKVEEYQNYEDKL